MIHNPLRESGFFAEVFRKYQVVRERVAFSRTLMAADPVIVFSVEKVGSVSVYKALKPVYPDELMHAHTYGNPLPTGGAAIMESISRKGDG